MGNDGEQQPATQHHQRLHGQREPYAKHGRAPASSEVRQSEEPGADDGCSPEPQKPAQDGCQHAPVRVLFNASGHQGDGDPDGITRRGLSQLAPQGITGTEWLARLEPRNERRSSDDHDCRETGCHRER